MEDLDRFAPAELDGRARAELFEFLRIPSISGDPRCRADVDAAAAWVEAKIARAGGTARRLERSNALPVVVGDVSASAGRCDAPRILVYGHFDVQPTGPLERWESPPFRPEVRGEWLYGRGAADDKGQLWILLEAVERLDE